LKKRNDSLHAFIVRIIPLFLLPAVLFSPQAARAEYTFPVSLCEIGDEAFSGAELPASVVLPGSVRAIGNSAFYGCETLMEITIPDSVSEIGEDAFTGCSEAVLLHCGTGSAACSYAITHNLDYEAGTVCRALLIGQNYTGTTYALLGPSNDVRAMRFCLQNMSKRPYQVTTVSNQTAEEMLSAIGRTFASASSRDLSLLYYSGHGDTDGSLVGTGNTTVSPAQLRAALDQIPGRKIVIVDACFSGQLITTRGTTNRGTGPSAAFVSAFQNAFSQRNRGELNTDAYFVITAAAENEQSAENYIVSGSSGRYMGYFTYGFCLGCGWDGVANRAGNMAADTNEDGAVSLQEAYAYAGTYAKAQNSLQSAAVWPTNCRWFAPFR